MCSVRPFNGGGFFVKISLLKFEMQYFLKNKEQLFVCILIVLCNQQNPCYCLQGKISTSCQIE